MQFIFDTNELLSALLFENSLPALALKKSHTIGTLIFSGETLTELKDVLSRSKFDKYLSLRERLYKLETLNPQLVALPELKSTNICRDPKDEKFLTLASLYKPDCIVSGDEDLLILNPFRAIPILTPRQFLEGF